TKSNPTQNYLSAHTNCMIFLLLKNCWPEACQTYRRALATTGSDYTAFPLQVKHLSNKNLI
ncbi:hypothetical protein, partial [Piscirickettsia salmonis]|uniref:hypothetical protein n=1 Tax=Piscirickettsia salmonis TaxID=1238 RepID=UPI000BFB0011